MTGRPGDPYPNHHFRVEIDGIANLDFAEVILPEARADIIEYREGGERAAHKVIGALHVGTLVLRRGVTHSNDLFQWWKNIAAGVPDRRNILVTLLDSDFNPVKRWAGANARPPRYAVSPLIPLPDGVALIETIERPAQWFQPVTSSASRPPT